MTVSAAEKRAASMVTIQGMLAARACSYCSVGDGAACPTTQIHPLYPPFHSLIQIPSNPTQGNEANSYPLFDAGEHEFWLQICQDPLTNCCHVRSFNSTCYSDRNAHRAGVEGERGEAGAPGVETRP